MPRSLGIDCFLPCQAPGENFFYYKEMTFLKKSRKKTNFGLPYFSLGCRHYLVCLILGGAATCSEGFLICFLKVPFDCLGSMAAAVMPGELSEKNLRNKWLPHPIQEGTVIAEWKFLCSFLVCATTRQTINPPPLSW